VGVIALSDLPHSLAKAGFEEDIQQNGSNGIGSRVPLFFSAAEEGEVCSVRYSFT
jgi:hypothetical protein